MSLLSAFYFHDAYKNATESIRSICLGFKRTLAIMQVVEVH